MSAEPIQGGFTGGVEELYREVILDHFKSPKNRGQAAPSNFQADGTNPLCGDQISISGLVDHEILKDVKFDGHGCAISQSAASMLTELVRGKPLAEARNLINGFKNMFGVEGTGKTNLGEDELGDLVALEGVKKYPVRIKCAVLSANTLLQALDDLSKKAGA